MEWWGEKSRLPPTYVPISIASGMRAAAMRTPAKLALREGDRCLTYAELADRTARVSGIVRGRLGLGTGAAGGEQRQEGEGGE